MNIKHGRRWGLAAFFVPVMAIVAAGSPSAAYAKPCTDFEREVVALKAEAKDFQHSSRFKEYGFSARGGYAPWLARMQSLSKHPDSSAFFAQYGYNPESIYQVADEYRTAGELDSFFRDMEIQIDNGPKCDN